MRILLIGGPGNISKGTIVQLLKRNEELAVYTLPETDISEFKRSIKFYFGNREDEAELSGVVNDFRPDIVIDFVCFKPEQCEMICKIINGKVKQYILVSTVDVYGYPLSQLPMPESGTFKVPLTQYAKDKLSCEQVLNKFPGLTCTIARPSYSMGNSFVMTPVSHLGGRQLISRLKKGMPVFVPGDGTTLVHASIAYNTGCMIARFAGNEKSFGKSYNCAHEYFITWDDYIQLFGDALGVKPEVVHIPSDWVENNFKEEYPHTMLSLITRYNLAFDLKRFKSDFPDFVWEISLKQFINEYIWYCDKYNLLYNPDDEILDDKIIRKWRKAYV